LANARGAGPHRAPYDAAMPGNTDIRVALVTPGLADAVRALRIAPEQYAYVGDVAFNLASADGDVRSDAMAVLLDGRVVGFYRLDYAPTIVAWKPICSASVGLRAFLIDQSLQGRGLAPRAIVACCEDLRQRHPERRLLALNVNCRNVAAIRAYRKSGFVDTGELYFGGSAGPQHLMVRRLA
jgi:RimJ/RimL family protein N-acetyltransferase